MILSSLTLENFRNLTNQRLFFSKQANIVCGKNGQGKTNLLEAIFLLASTRSFRTSLNREIVQWGMSGFRLEGDVEKHQQAYSLDVQQWDHGKKLRINQRPREIFDYIGHLSVQVFSSSQMERFRAEAEQRRRFIDRALYLLQPLHLRRMADYARVVKQKNSLLKDPCSIYNKEFGNLLDVWDQEIAAIGARIIKARNDYVEKLQLKLVLQAESLVPECLEMCYRPCQGLSGQQDAAGIESQLRDALKSCREKEIRLKRSLVGPHRDEVMLVINGEEMQRFASAGQQRSALLACHLTQMELHLLELEEYPVFLIDDVDAELDDERMNRVVELLRRKTQVFMTTTRPERISLNEHRQTAKWFQLESGNVIESGVPQTYSH
ncbi:MAG: DNA replication/repair protein RecF [Terriglobia bacterium]